MEALELCSSLYVAASYNEQIVREVVANLTSAFFDKGYRIYGLLVIPEKEVYVSFDLINQFLSISGYYFEPDETAWGEIALELTGGAVRRWKGIVLMSEFLTRNYAVMYNFL